ncbi:MAG: hypothetical protein A2Y90_06210 [Chloroflexi bacterium RBG_13_52_12]|nr:MAG: hypothetical protein A2Y90_06210 [Chloroflexi bacterium RBG_13_52_12]
MRKKRRRGGQPCNQNARKHGFYSTTLTPQEICEFWNIVNLEGLAPEAVVLRLKLKSALLNAPGNYRVLRESSKLLVKWYNSQIHMNRKDNAEFKRVVRNILKASATGDMSLAERIIAESLE